MKRIDLQFMLLAAAMLIAGVSLGIYMAASQEFQWRPIHAHINLVGWASMAVFGLTYRAYPELAANRLARVHIILAAPAALMLPAGIALAIFRQSEVMAISASFLWLGACILFLVQLFRLAFVRIADPALAPAE